MNSENRIYQSYYQKGYSDGYKRLKDNLETQKEQDIIYIYNVALLIVIFCIFLFSVYFYGHTGIHSNYEGDCLIDLATSYQAGNCLKY
jgi:hypothetical protein